MQLSGFEVGHRETHTERERERERQRERETERERDRESGPDFAVSADYGPIINH